MLFDGRKKSCQGSYLRAESILLPCLSFSYLIIIGIIADESENDTPGGSGIKSSRKLTEEQRTNHNVTATNDRSPCADATIVNVLKSNDTKVQTQNSRVMSPSAKFTPSVSSSAKASTSDIVDTCTHVSSDIVLKYQQLKKAQEQLKNEVSDLLQTPETFACPTVGSSDTMISGNEVNSPLLQSFNCSYTTPSPHNTSVKSTTNPVLLRYHQWKKDQEMTMSSVTAVTTSPRPERPVGSAPLTTKIMSDNPLLKYQMDSQVRDHKNPRLTSNDASRTSEVTLNSLLLGNQGNASVSSPILQSPNLQVDDLLTPRVNGHHGLPWKPKLEDTVATKDTDATHPHQQETHVTYSKGFATPMMSFLGNHDVEQTPLEYIRPPIDFNSNSLNQDRRESVRSRLSFDISTPRSSLPMSSAQHAFLNTPTAREIANVKVDNIIGQRKFDLIPVNMDDLLEDNYQLPIGEVAEGMLMYMCLCTGIFGSNRNGPFPYYMKFEKIQNRQKYHHSLKEHPTFSKIAKFGCEML